MIVAIISLAGLALFIGGAVVGLLTSFRVRAAFYAALLGFAMFIGGTLVAANQVSSAIAGD